MAARPILWKNLRLVPPGWTSGEIAASDLLTEGARIVWLGEPDRAPDGLAPGFINILH